MKKRAVLTITFLVSIFAIAFPAFAQDLVTPEPVPPIQEPPIWDFRGLSIKYQRVDVQIEDQVATTHIDQLFVNNNDWILEGTYLFPLPVGATVSELTMWIDGQPIESKILEADEARQIYDRIVRQLRDPALLEYVGTSTIQANVFPIPPNEERRIEIEYTQILPAENGLIHFTYPQSTDLYTNTPLNNQSFRVEVRSEQEIRAVYSPSHSVAIDRDGDFRVVIGYEAADVIPNKDFDLYYSIAPEDIGLNLLSFKESGEDGFFLLLVAPSIETRLDEIVSKDVIMVIDTSGSMAGEKLSQAQEAASFVVDNLNPDDRFNLIAFSTGVRSYSRDLVRASDPGNIHQFIDNLDAIGGTNISSALLEAVAFVDNDRPTTVLFLTDGLATEGIVDTPLLLDTVRDQAPENVRVFAFGVGDDVDTLLLDSLAQEHGGATTYVRPGQQIDEAVSSFYAKVNMPVLANIDIDFGNIVAEQIYPQEYPDLFAGTQLVLAGKYREGGAASITLMGEVNGRTETFIYEDNFFRNSGGDDFIPRLWATRAVGNLLTQIRLHGENPELVQSVIDLSIRYGIITPYTSYLIEEDDIFTQTGRNMIFEEEVAEFSRVMPSSGQRAVDMAVEEAELAAAEAPASESQAIILADDGSERYVGELVQHSGSKTFVYKDGIWIDTTFDADLHKPQKVSFASETYFELLASAPNLGQYLSIGNELLVVFEGIAYRITDGDGDSSIIMPQGNLDNGNENQQDAGNNQTDGQITNDGQPGTSGNKGNNLQTPQSTNSSAPSEGNSNTICASAFAVPFLIVGMAVVFTRKRRL